MRVLSATISLVVLNSCEVDWFRLDEHYVVVDHQAQDIRIEADNDVSGVGFFLYQSDSKEGTYYMSGDTLFLVGDWFRLILDKNDSRHILISVDENQTEKTRSVLVEVNHSALNDTVRIVQKAKPASMME